MTSPAVTVRRGVYANKLDAAMNTAISMPTEESPATRSVDAGLLVTAGSFVLVGVVVVGVAVDLEASTFFRLAVGTGSLFGDLKGSRVPMHFVCSSLQALWPLKSSGWFSMHCA
ncbi:hypothetical protein BDDG_12125 [Blastomyces dermatitidis ATCC 18188]|uniref:Uncharacterized protein n=1 Tax=Ajellomyces dermatitidis (strain ATCC 18188 / CBS 674.68) TaxID=653446 RepID=A0A0J9EMX1_AJEDA|nr:hypothetical protein BDDG_12125 [Blastomyces dermatitidis ATCC 18188]